MAAPTKTVAQKLLIKPGTTVWATPEEHLPLIGALPVDVDVADVLSTATTGLMFAADESALHRLLDEHRDGLSGAVNFWVVYPKGNKADINRDSLRRILAEYGMRPIAQIAVDETWSALRFRMLREGRSSTPTRATDALLGPAGSGTHPASGVAECGRPSADIATSNSVRCACADQAGSWGSLDYGDQSSASMPVRSLASVRLRRRETCIWETPSTSPI